MEDVFQNAEKVFVSAEENTDETYGGAYLKAIPTNRINWGNVFVTPKYATEAFAEYDVVTAWIYVLADDNNPVTALFALNANTQTVAVNQWVQIAIPMDVYVTSVASGTPVFIALNYKATVSGVYIGEIKAANSAELSISDIEESVLDGESVNVEFTVTANPAETELSVSVVSALGETLEVVALGAALYDQIWLGSYMSGGVGFTQYATAAYTDNVLDDFTYYGKDYVEDKYGDLCSAPNNMDTVLDVGTEVAFYALEQYEEYPALLETHFGGSQ